jgi:uncharacterized protein (TIGR03437 family)
LDAGATPGCTSDVTFTGMQIGPSGTATLYAVPGAGGSAEYDSLTLTALQNQTYQMIPINIAVNDVFAVKTNAGDYAKVLVTATSSNSVSLQYTTYGATANAPVILSVMNNYSYSKVAPGSLFTIFGCGLATAGATAVLQDTTKGLPQTLNGASISVTAGGVTTHPALYYATATQIAAVLPSSTPTGAGTVTVTYNNQAGSPAAIAIWPTAFGFDSYDQSGSGTGVATDSLNYRLITSTNSAMPGQLMTFWGSGLGADPQDSDTTYTASPHGISVPQFPLQVLIGGIPANILYQGSSGYPGLNQINVVIPQNVPQGCAVSVVAQSANFQVISNSVTLPISSFGGMCTDPLMGISTAEAAALSGKATVNVGVLAVEEVNGPFADGAALADFFTMSGTAFSSWAAQQDGYTSPAVSLGNCAGGAYINDLWLPVAAAQAAINAGAMTFNGPGGSRSLPFQNQLGSYELLLGFQDNLWNPMTGGTYTFSGGQGANAFTASLNFPIASTSFGFLVGGLTLAPGEAQPTGVVLTRAGTTVDWAGGSTSQYITLSGTAGSASFVCNAPAVAGTFTIPPAVLEPLSGSGTLTIRVATYPQPLTMPGLDAAYIIGYATPLSSLNVTYQ